MFLVTPLYFGNTGYVVNATSPIRDVGERSPAAAPHHRGETGRTASIARMHYDPIVKLFICSLLVGGARTVANSKYGWRKQGQRKAFPTQFPILLAHRTHPSGSPKPDESRTESKAASHRQGWRRRRRFAPLVRRNPKECRIFLGGTAAAHACGCGQHERDSQMASHSHTTFGRQFSGSSQRPKVCRRATKRMTRAAVIGNQMAGKSGIFHDNIQKA